MDFITPRVRMRSRGKAIGLSVCLSVCLSVRGHKNLHISRSRHLSDS
jgi:hypothetical protein